MSTQWPRFDENRLGTKNPPSADKQISQEVEAGKDIVEGVGFNCCWLASQIMPPV